MKHAVNIIKSECWSSPFDPGYLDETSELKIESDIIRAQKDGKTYVPKPWEAFDYLNKDDLGLVHVRGFLVKEVCDNEDGSFSHLLSLDRQDIKRRLTKKWVSHAEQFPKLAVSQHRVVFSLSNEFRQTLLKAGRNPDEALKGIIERSFRNFTDKYHRGDSIGYAYGLHHDTDNLHAHVFIHPRTKQGAYIGLSQGLKNSKQVRENQLKFLHEAANRQVFRILKEIKSGSQNEQHLVMSPHADKIFVAPSFKNLPIIVPDPQAPHARHIQAIGKLEKNIASIDQRIRTVQSDIRTIKFQSVSSSGSTKKLDALKAEGEHLSMRIAQIKQDLATSKTSSTEAAVNWKQTKSHKRSLKLSRRGLTLMGFKKNGFVRLVEAVADLAARRQARQFKNSQSVRYKQAQALRQEMRDLIQKKISLRNQYLSVLEQVKIERNNRYAKSHSTRIGIQIR